MDYGDSAFPRTVTDWNPDSEKREVTSEGGMTLRDYFAAHSVQPGAGEIVSLAGLVLRCGIVWSDATTRIGTFDEWFNALPLSERLDLFSRVKYAMADAMLKARLS